MNTKELTAMLDQLSAMLETSEQKAIRTGDIATIRKIGRVLDATDTVLEYLFEMN